MCYCFSLYIYVNDVVASLINSAALPAVDKARDWETYKSISSMASEVREEFELNEIKDTMHGSFGSRLSLFSREFRFAKNRHADRLSKFSMDCHGQGWIIHPEGRLYKWWGNMFVLWCIYSTFFTPLEFGFFRGLPDYLMSIDTGVQLIFLADVVMQFFVAYRDDHTYKMVYDKESIALRYMKTHFVLDFMCCLPWDLIYKATGKHELARCLIWLRLYRARKVNDFFHQMEKDIRINYLFTRIVKLITVELYCTHTAACIFYYLATTLPPAMEGQTWIGSLTLGDYHFFNFREIDLWTRYITSLYFAIVTMATVGYGDIHAVNTREMVFVMIYVSFDMILGAYLIGNMTALIVKGSKTERYRDKMTDIIKYMNRNKLGKDIRSQIKGHLQLQYESSYTEASILEDIPIAIRSKISQTLYINTVLQVSLFKGCSEAFLNQIVTKMNEEFFLPGEVILEQGNAVDQIYIVCHGTLEEASIGEDGNEECVNQLEPYNVFGDVAIICNIPQPYTVRVCELCRLIRIDKQAFTNTLQLYFSDSHQILNNLVKGKDMELKARQLETDIAYLVLKQEAEVVLRVNSAAYHGDLYGVKSFISAGADPKKADYDGRTPLHLAASRGYEGIVLFLIQHGADLNCIDNFGNSPLFEALKSGHDRVASLLVKHGACLNLEDAGNYLCKAVTNSNIDLLCRLLTNGVDPNSKNYDGRTALHVAAAEGLHIIANILIKHGADVHSSDRWEKTPLDEAQLCGSKPLIKMLENVEGHHELSQKKNQQQAVRVAS